MGDGWGDVRIVVVEERERWLHVVCIHVLADSCTGANSKRAPCEPSMQPRGTVMLIALAAARPPRDHTPPCLDSHQHTLIVGIVGMSLPTSENDREHRQLGGFAC